MTATNYCPYCGRFMMMKEFDHACDRTNQANEMKEWCSRCGGKTDPMTADNETGLCHVCRSRIDPFSKEFD